MSPSQAAQVIALPGPLVWAGEHAGSGKIIGNRCTACARLVLPGRASCSCQDEEWCPKALEQKMLKLTERTYWEVALQVRQLMLKGGMEAFVELSRLMLRLQGPAVCQLAHDMCRWTAKEGCLRDSEFRRALLSQCQAEFATVLQKDEDTAVRLARFLSELNWRGIIGTKTLCGCAEKLLLNLSDVNDPRVPRVLLILVELLGHGQLEYPEFAEVRTAIDSLKKSDIGLDLCMLLITLDEEAP